MSKDRIITKAMYRTVIEEMANALKIAGSSVIASIKDMTYKELEENFQMLKLMLKIFIRPILSESELDGIKFE